MTKRRDLTAELTKARQQLQKAQLRVAALEAQVPAVQIPAVDTTQSYQIFDNMLEGCQLIDFDWRYRYLNDTAVRHALRTRDELLGSTMMEQYPAIEQSPMFAVLQRCMQERTAENIENEFSYPDGTIAWFELRVQPVPEGIFVFSLDITEQKRTEAAEREQAEWMRMALAASHLGKWQHDIATGVIRFDECARLQYGFACETVTIDRMLNQLHPEDVSRLGEELAFAMNPANDGRFATEYRVVHPDGSVHWLAVQVQVYFAGEGEARYPARGFGTCQEITARKAAEDALKRYTLRLEILRGIDIGIINAHSIPEIMATSLKQIRAFFGCQQAGALLFDFSTDEVLLFAGDTHSPSAIKQGVRYPLTPGFLEEFGAMQVTVIDDLLSLPASNPSYQRVKQEGMRSSLRALLMLQERPLGVLVLNADTPNYFSAEQQAIAAEIANQLAIAIKQQQLADDLAHHVQTLEEMRQFLQTTLDAFPANTTVLDPNGTIITVNLLWKHFADENNAQSTTHYLGANYLTICNKAVGPMSEEAVAAAAGIQAVIAGRRDDFYLEYPCNSPTQERWFMLRVTPFVEPPPRRVVVAHIDITERKAAEKAEHEQRLLAEAMHDSLVVLTASVDVETVMQQILAYSATVIPSEAGTIILFEGNQGRVAYLRGHSAEAEAFFKANPIAFDAGVYAGVYGSSTYYLVADTKLASDWRSFPVTGWVRSSIGVQIVVRGEPIGLLIMDSATPNRFQQKDVENLQSFARYAALALENAHHVTHLEQRVRARTVELRSTKERVEAILNNSADGILLIHLDLSIQQTNPSFNRLFGCETDEYLDKLLADLIQPEDFAAVIQLIQAVAMEQPRQRVEVRAKRKDGTLFDVELSIGLIKGDGLVCTIRDITERKARDRQLRYHASLQENVSDAVIVTDMDFRIQSWNQAAERIYGWCAEEVVGQTTEILRTQFASLADRERSRQQLRDQNAWQGEVIQRHKDGTLRSILGSVTLVKDERGIPASVVAVNRDITERKRTEVILVARMEEEREFQGYLKALHEITIELTQIDDLDAFYQSTVELGLMRLGFDRLGLFLYDEEAGTALGTYGTDAQGKLVNKQHISFTPNPNGIMQRSFTRSARFCFDENITLYENQQSVGVGWNAAAVLWNGTQRMGWLVIDNLLSQKPASKPQLDTLGLYALTVGALLAQKQMQLALRESETRYRLVAENISDVVVRTNAVAECLYVSPSSRIILGYEPIEFVGQNVITFVHPEDLPAVEQALLRTRPQNRSDASIIVRFRHKQGHYLWLEIMIQTVRAEKTGEIEGFVGSARDISDRKGAEAALKESEAQYRRLIENMRGGLAVYDVNDRVTYVNDRACEMLGFSRHEIIGTRPYDHVDDSNAQKIKTQLGKRRLQEVSPYELLIKRKNGSPIHLLIAGSSLFDKDGVYNGSLIVTTDISVQKQAEETLRQALVKEKELGELKSRFISMASHEFRTPLATILMLTETLSAYRHRLSEAQIEQRLNRIKEQVDHLKDIMEDVLLLAQMQARRAQFNPIKLDLDALCRTVLDEFQSRVDIKHRLEYRRSEANYIVKFDPKLMRQIIGNLVSNAIKYSAVDKLVLVSLAFVGEVCVLQVHDEGIGIPEADLQHLFEPFHRATNVGAISGTGLGLVITKEAVELHNGTITCESQLDRGTTFTIRIPIFPHEEMAEDNNFSD